MKNEMAYRHCFKVLGAFLHFADDTVPLEQVISRRQDIDFGEYSPKGGGTTVAHLRWALGGSSCEFEGMSGTLTVAKTRAVGEETSDEAFVALVHKYWLIFTADEERLARERRAARVPA